MSILNKIFRDPGTKKLKKMTRSVALVNSFYTVFDSLSDAELAAKTLEFQDRFKKGESLDDLLPEAFAAVKQACKRLVGRTWKVHNSGTH